MSVALREIISTSVRMSQKVKESIWLDGGKLLRGQYNKGDTLQVVTKKDSIVLKKVSALPRATNATVNVSGRKNASRDQVMPLLELPLNKSTMTWEAGTPLKIQITKDAIIIQVNTYLLQRKKRASKFLEMLRTKKAKHLKISLADTPKHPMANDTDSADTCELDFDESEQTSSFFNALRSIEQSNPFAITVNNIASDCNVLGEGIISILNSLEYATYDFKDRLVAVSKNIDFDLDSAIQQTSTPLHCDLFEVNDVIQVEPNYGKKIALKDDRKHQLDRDIAKGTISLASLFHGGGTFEHAAASVFESSKLTPQLALVSEIEDSYIQHSVEVNASSYCDSTVILNGDMNHFDASNCNVSATLLTSGISCIGASRAGISKGGYGSAERHPKAGSLFWPTIKLLTALNPYYYLLENTDSYRSTKSFLCIKLILEQLGYIFEEGVLDSHNYGSTESRKRVFLMACSDEDKHDLNEVSPLSASHHFVGPRVTINHLLDASVTESSDMYRSYDHLKAKAVRDAENGKGFGRHLMTGQETRSNVIRAQYAKAGSSDCYHLHPTDPELSRLYTPLEHARIKSFDSSFITDAKATSKTLLHTVLGQGIPRPVGAKMAEMFCRLIYKYDTRKQSQQFAA